MKSETGYFGSLTDSPCLQTDTRLWREMIGMEPDTMPSKRHLSKQPPHFQKMNYSSLEMQGTMQKSRIQAKSTKKQKFLKKKLMN